jgi:hypothetical protein
MNEPPTKQRIIWDGFGQDDQQFVGELAYSMGVFASANIWSVNNLKQIIKQKNDEIAHLEDKLKQKETLIEKQVEVKISQGQQTHFQEMKSLEEQMKDGITRVQQLLSDSISENNAQITQLQTQI